MNQFGLNSVHKHPIPKFKSSWLTDLIRHFYKNDGYLKIWNCNKIGIWNELVEILHIHSPYETHNAVPWSTSTVILNQNAATLKFQVKKNPICKSIWLKPHCFFALNLIKFIYIGNEILKSMFSVQNIMLKIYSLFAVFCHLKKSNKRILLDYKIRCYYQQVHFRLYYASVIVIIYWIQLYFIK